MSQLVSVYFSPCQMRYSCFYSIFSCAYHDFCDFSIYFKHTFLSNVSCHLATVLCNCSSFSANITRSSAYSSFHNYYSLILSLNTCTTTNMKGLSADPWCKLTVPGKTADSPHSVLTLAVASLYISSTKFTIGYGTALFLSQSP